MAPTIVLFSFPEVDLSYFSNFLLQLALIQLYY